MAYAVAAVIVVLAFLAWFFPAAVKAWRAPAGRDVLDRCLPQAATISIVLLLLHSFVDYPLRTTALSSLFAFACAHCEPGPNRFTRSRRACCARSGSSMRFSYMSMISR